MHFRIITSRQSQYSLTSRRKNMTHIDIYQDSDEAEVIKLWQRCGLTVPWNDPQKDILRKLEVAPELFLVYKLKGLLVGSIMGGYEGHRGWINYLAVDPDHQRQGIGKQLVEAIEDRLLVLDCPKINLQIRESNLDVIKFYEALGYKIDPVVSMGKRLIAD